MAFFGRSGQAAANNQEQEVGIGMEEQENQKTALDLNQVEENIHQLVKKINLGKEKNAHLIQNQKQKLEKAQMEYEGLSNLLGQTQASISSGLIKDQGNYRDTVKRLEELSGKVSGKKTEIDRLKTDIFLLENEKDTEAIDALLQEWRAYEKDMFEEHISPLIKETIAAKELYYEKLKELRSNYSNVEKLAVQTNTSLADSDKVTVHKWFDVTQNNPALLITKYDEQKEEAITHSYLAE